MEADKIVKITPETVRELIERRRIPSHAKFPAARRKEEREAFAGTVEIWLPDECYGEKHLLATLHNLSPHGLAMRTRRPIPSDTRVSIALHQPEMSCYGKGTVRHCNSANLGYLIGVEFIFEEEPEDHRG